MFDGWSRAVKGLLELLLPLYRNTDFAYGLAAWMTAVALILLVLAVLRHVQQGAALQGRIAALTQFISFGSRGAQGEADSREAIFASRFQEIDERMSRTDNMSGGLAHAWRRYRRTLNFVSAPPVRASQRPNNFFYVAMPPPTWLGFAANILVAFGLLATFLGLVAALSFAAVGMAADDTAAMQQALRDLLGAAASKFVTSVAGVALSIVLRVAERVLTADLRARIDRLSSALEFGIRVEPDSHIAALSDRIAALLEKTAADKQPTEAP